MASVLTDKYIPGSQVATLVGLTTSAVAPQFAAPSLSGPNKGGRSGNATVLFPSPANAALSLNSRLYRARVNFTVFTTANANVTVNLNITDSAGTATAIATTGALAVNGTSSGVLETQFFYDATTGLVTGIQNGWIGVNIKASAVLSSFPTLVINNSVPVQIGPTALISAAQTGATLTIHSIELELL